MGSPRRNVMHTVLIIFLNILTITAVHGKRERIPIKKAPYQVLVKLQSAENPELYGHGGGVIISKEWIVTAAHVCTDLNKERYHIIAGTNVWDNGGSRHHLSKIIIHPDWATVGPNGIYANDIALMKVKQPFVFDTTRQYLHLNEQPTSEIVGDIGMVSGWPGSDRYLSRAYCEIISKAACKKYITISDGVLCSDLCANNAKLQCGDSGGPFVVDCKLVGIVAQRTLCTRKSSFYVLTYTEISHYIKWIKKYVELPNEGGGCNIMSPLHHDKPNVKVSLELTF